MPASSMVVRDATKLDIPNLADLFFASFMPSHPWWPNLFPPNDAGKQWWNEAWRLGIEEDSSTRTLVAVDVKTNIPVAFARWIVPQDNGNLAVKWPELLPEWDMELHQPFWSGMADNRKVLMGSRPHWFLELLGVDPDYQRLGIGEKLVRWGCDQADEMNMECYIDASMTGAPFYQKHFGFETKKEIALPKRPNAYGEYLYVSQVRPAKKA